MIFTPKYIQVCTLEEALDVFRGNKAALARELGIGRGTLRRHLNDSGEQLLKVVPDVDKGINFEYINKGFLK